MFLRSGKSEKQSQSCALGAVPFLDFVARNFDPTWYLARNPDVAASKVDPLRHWLEFGLREGRSFAPALEIRIQRDNEPIDGQAAETMQYGGATLVVRRREDSDEEFLSFIKKHFSGEWYLTANPDLAAVKLDPWLHWIEHGIWENRKPSPSIEIHFVKDGQRQDNRFSREFVYRGEALRVLTLDEDILRQILEQGEIDPSVLAPGTLALPALRQIDAPDLWDRYGIDTATLFAPFQEKPKYVFIMNRLGVGGSEKYVSDIVHALRETGERSIAIIVTDQKEQEAGEWQSLAILRPLAGLSILFWPDACGGYRSYDAAGVFDSSAVLARLLNSLRPKHIFVSNTRMGFEAIARFGRGLSHFASLYCGYYVLGYRALGAPFALRFPPLTAPHATTVTDNEPVADILQQRYGQLHKKGIRVLNLRLKVIEDQEFSRRLIARKLRFSKRNHIARWVWISRLNMHQKGTAILAELAKIRPIDRFDVYGPQEWPLEQLGLAAPNIKYCGTLADVIAADLSNYDGFIFTSMFEGMPNVVVEVTNHAIPMILSNVGGLRNTFDETAVHFVDPHDDPLEMAKMFCPKMDCVRAMTPDTLEIRMRRMREQVLKVHHPDIYKRAVIELFGAA